MRCSTLPGAAAQQSRAEAPLPPIAYVPTSCRAAGRRQRASSDDTKNLKRLQTQRFRGGTRNHRSVAGRTAGVCVAQLLTSAPA